MPVSHTRAKNYCRILLRPSRIVELLFLVVDYAVFRWSMCKVRRERKPQSTDVVIFVSLNDWMPRVKSEAILALKLWVEGNEPCILTSRKATWAKRYFRACGITRFVDIEDMHQKPVQNEDQIIEGLLAKNPAFEDLLNYEYEGASVGKHVLSSAVRQLRCGTLDMHSQEVLELLRALLRTSLRTVRSGKEFFTKMHPVAVFWNERGYTPYAELYDCGLLAHCTVIQYVHAHRADALIFRRGTVHNKNLHSFSLSEASWKYAISMPWNSAQGKQVIDILNKGYADGSWCNYSPTSSPKPIVKAEELKKTLGLDVHKKTAIVFSHMLWDATFFYGTNLFPDYEQWLIATVQAACKNTTVNWIIKLHPDYVWKMKQAGDKRDPRDVLALESSIGTLPPHVHLLLPNTSINTYSLFSIMDYCVTVRGTIGIEASCFGIPVLTAGTGRYSGRGFTIDSQSRDEYLERLLHIEKIPGMSEGETEMALRHGYALFVLRPLFFMSFALRHSLWGKIIPKASQNTTVRVHSTQELKQADDLKSFAHWVLHSKEEDYFHFSK